MSLLTIATLFQAVSACLRRIVAYRAAMVLVRRGSAAETGKNTPSKFVGHGAGFRGLCGATAACLWAGGGGFAFRETGYGQGTAPLPSNSARVLGGRNDAVWRSGQTSKSGRRRRGTLTCGSGAKSSRAECLVAPGCGGGAGQKRRRPTAATKAAGAWRP